MFYGRLFFVRLKTLTKRSLVTFDCVHNERVVLILLNVRCEFEHDNSNKNQIVIICN